MFYQGQTIGSDMMLKLSKNKPHSHKGENGKLLIIGGSEKYHGAPILSAKIASKIVDLVYFASVPENNALLQKIKSELCEFIALKRAEIMPIAEKADVILIGPGLDGAEELGQFVNEMLNKFPQKKFVLDADAFHYLEKNLLNENILLTPHKTEFRAFFNCEATEENVRKMAQKYNCILVLKGKEDFVASKSDFKINQTGNAGMTKGGTGDVLAGLIAGLACKNELFLSACIGVFANGVAGDRLQAKVGDYFNASDLINEIPQILHSFDKDKKSI